MKALLTATALVLALGGAAAAETRAVTGFTSVSVGAGIDVEISIGQNFRVDVTGSDAARVTTRVIGGELRIERENHWGWGRRDAQVRITMPRVEGLEASSGAHINAVGVQAASLSLEASSGGGLTVAGSCGSVDAEASSGARLNASALRCERGAVEASSGARADVNVSGPLDVEASSGGDIYAGGGAQIGNVSLSSGGSLHRS